VAATLRAGFSGPSEQHTSRHLQCGVMQAPDNFCVITSHRPEATRHRVHVTTHKTANVLTIRDLQGGEEQVS
jgi:hypothetical protein